MTAEPRCRCCGIPVTGARAQFRVCIGCDRCDGLHGAVLQGVLVKAVADGQIDPGVALARSVMDDAQLAGRLVFVTEGVLSRVASIRIDDPPERWRVVIARALARNELPDVAGVVDAIMQRWLPAPYTARLAANLRADLLPALQIIDRDIMDVEIDCKRDIADPEHLIIRLQARTPVLGVNLGAAIGGESGVELPADIMSRPRGSA